MTRPRGVIWGGPGQGIRPERCKNLGPGGGPHIRDTFPFPSQPPPSPLNLHRHTGYKRKTPVGHGGYYRERLHQKSSGQGITFDALLLISINRFSSFKSTTILGLPIFWRWVPIRCIWPRTTQLRTVPACSPNSLAASLTVSRLLLRISIRRDFTIATPPHA